MPEVPQRVGLVSCSKAKLDRPVPARELYSASDLFRKASRYCETNCDGWFILSAKHGLVHPDQVLEPYDLTLKNLPRPELREWGRRVAKQLRDLGNVRFEAHAGRDYIWPLEDVGIRVTNPLAGLSFGHRLRWYLERSDDH